MEVLRGRDGRDGRDGDKGEKGSTGEKGEQGQVGNSGPQGPDGMKGMQGYSGPAGPQGPQGVRGLPGGGTTYIRWGRTTCPTGQGTELVYSGRAGASQRHHKGGAANYLCMPDDPDHLSFQSGVQTDRNYVTGVEYWYAAIPSVSSVNNHNAPCALCYVANRSVSVMIPAKTVCPANWTLEYIGYLMSEHHNHHRTMYECVDKDPESVPGLNSGSEPRAYFEVVEPYCNGLSCSPYDDEKELTCAVCTR